MSHCTRNYEVELFANMRFLNFLPLGHSSYTNEKGLLQQEGSGAPGLKTNEPLKKEMNKQKVDLENTQSVMAAFLQGDAT